MGIINLLHTSSRGAKQFKIPKEETAGTGLSKIHLSSNSWRFGVIIIIVLEAVALLALFIHIKVKENNIVSLRKKIQQVNGIYRIVDELNTKKKKLTEILTISEELFEKNLVWTKKLNAISKCISGEIWLNSISVDTKTTKETQASKTAASQPQTITTKTLLIKGSATSPIRGNIIASVAKFAEDLKQNADFNEDLEEIKWGPLQAEKKFNFVVMNFSLQCRFKFYGQDPTTK